MESLGVKTCRHRSFLVVWGAFLLCGFVAAGCGGDGSGALDSGMADAAPVDAGGGGDAGGDDGGQDAGGGGDVCQELEDALFFVAEGSLVRGLAVGVQTTECGRWVASLGEAEVGVALTRERLFRVASVTKTYTAATVLRLVEQGQLSLDDTVDTFVAGLPNGDVMTVRHLLRHESGLFDIIDDPNFMQQAAENPTQPVNPEDMVTTAASHGAVFEPGTQASYCNTNYHVLGLIIQQVTGLSAAAVLEQQVVLPLSLSETVLEGDPPMSDVLVPGFNEFGVDVTNALHPTIRWTAGAMVTDVDELLTWTAALYQGELLGPTLQSAMVEECVDTGAACIGLGVVVRELSGVGEVWGHGGNTAGYRSYILYSPDLDVAVAVMANDVRADAAGTAVALMGAAANVIDGR